jgi:hypothetical protein
MAICTIGQKQNAELEIAPGRYSCVTTTWPSKRLVVATTLSAWKEARFGFHTPSICRGLNCTYLLTESQDGFHTPSKCRGLAHTSSLNLKMDSIQQETSMCTIHNTRGLNGQLQWVSTSWQSPCTNRYSKHHVTRMIINRSSYRPIRTQQFDQSKLKLGTTGILFDTPV